MNRKEAQAALREGKTLRHIYFTEEEWIREHSVGKLISEDGVIHGFWEFWGHRDSNIFDTGWSIVE